MKPSLADQLKDVKLDVHEYGRLPKREDIYFATGDEVLPPGLGDAIMKQWDKLNYLRKNLSKVSKYISGNKGETLNTWLANTGQGLKPDIVKSIGNYNDNTKGISAFFLNMQNLYDGEEKIYDSLESQMPVPQLSRDIINNSKEKEIAGMREERAQKRSARKKVRDMKLKDFEKDNTGFLVIKEDDLSGVKTVKVEGGKVADKPAEKKEQPKTVESFSGDGATIEKGTTPATPKEKWADNTVKKAPASSKKSITIMLAGAAVLVTVLLIAGVSKKSE